MTPSKLTEETIKLPTDQDASGRSFGEEELQGLREVLESGVLTATRGSAVRAFEGRFAELLGVRHAYACSSGTAAIHAAVAAIDPEPGDEIITTPITDMGALTPILYQGAIPVFADVDPRTCNVTAETLEARLSERTRAILVTHLFGNPCPMDEIMELARHRRLPVIEDCAQAYGARFRSHPVGSIGDIGCFSLQQGKHITTGEGGLVVTSDESLARRLSLFINKAWPYGEPSPDHTFLALNYRMSELQGAVGLAQLGKLSYAVGRRIAMADRLTAQIAGLPGLSPPWVPSGGEHSYWRYCLRVDRRVLLGGNEGLGQVLREKGIASTPRYIRQPAFRCHVFRDQRTFGSSRFPFTLARPDAVDYSPTLFPGTFEALDEILVLPWNERYTEEHADFIAGELREAVTRLLAGPRSGPVVTARQLYANGRAANGKDHSGNGEYDREGRDIASQHAARGDLARSTNGGNGRSAAKDQRIKFGIVGAGAIAQAYGQAFRASHEARLVAVADILPEAARALAEEFGCAAFTGHQQMAESLALDSVVVCTPPFSHAEICLDLLSRGIHVLCEKPFALDASTARAMVAAAESAGVMLTMASKFRYLDDVKRAKDMLTSGVLGEIVLFENAFTSRIDMARRWNSQPDISGGGVLIDNGTHSVDLVRHFLGPILEVNAIEGKNVQRLGVEDTVQVLMRAGDGIIATIDLSWSISKERPSFIDIYGSQGIARVGWQESCYRRSESSEWVVFGSGYNKVQALRDQIENFCRALNGREPLLISAEDSIASVEVIEAAYRSMRLNHSVTVPGRDADANALTSGVASLKNADRTNGVS